MIEVHWVKLLFMIPLSLYGAWCLGERIAACGTVSSLSDAIAAARSARLGYQPRPGRTRAIKRPPKAP